MIKPKILLLLIATHALIGLVGFAAGIYLLPILTAPDAPTDTTISEMSSTARYTTEFKKDLADSDFLHQGEGQVTVGDEHITFMGKISPGPNYKLYLSPEFVETEAAFEQLKSRMVAIGDVRTFDNFVVKVPPGVSVDDHNSVIVWCESFAEFITAAQYR